MKCRILILIVLAGCLSWTANAAEPPEFSAADFTVAEELLQAIGVQDQLDANINTMLDLQLRDNPQLQPMRGVLQAFLRKYLSYESLKKDYALIYLRAFTIPELKELTRFYRSPLGKKVNQRTPEIFRQGAELGAARVQAHIGELQAAIRAEQEKLAAPKQP